jgi:hypothetical protein
MSSPQPIVFSSLSTSTSIFIGSFAFLSILTSISLTPSLMVFVKA